VEAVAGDILDRESVVAAVRGMDVVIHAATSPYPRGQRTEVEGTRHVIDAAATTGAHVVYVSIVGVDRHRFPYYKAKWQAEQLVEASTSGWTIQRATQCHDMLDMFLGMPVFIRTPHLAFQVVDPGEVAQRLAHLVEAMPQGRVDDFGGPEIVPIQTLAAERQRITGRRSRLFRVQRIGFVRDFDDGKHLCPNHRVGRITWRDWLRASRTSQ